MPRQLLGYLGMVLGIAVVSPATLSAADENGEGYASWGQFHPYLCVKNEWTCTYWPDAATEGDVVYADCSPLYKWHNGIDVEYRCDEV